ncbi:MAG: rhombotarget lipoprotein [Pseudomonadota bacterium]
MERAFINLSIRILISLFIVALFGGCAWHSTNSTKHVTSTVDFLYPDTSAPIVTPGIPVLTLPLKVGIAFVPGKGGGNYGRGIREFWEADPFTEGRMPHGDFALTEKRKLALMQEVTEHFKQYSFVKEIQIIPSDDLIPSGSFANLDRIRALYGVNVIALLSYDQVQFTDDGVLSLTYWTIVGAYIIPGTKNDTHTMLDATIFDIKSRKLLFRAPGTSHIKGIATPANMSEQARTDSDEGFNEAVKSMITNLDEQLALFREKVKEHPTEFKVVE